MFGNVSTGGFNFLNVGHTLNGPVTGCTVLVGIIGNLTSLIVLRRNVFWKPMRPFIMALAAYDCLIAISAMVMQVIPTLLFSIFASPSTKFLLADPIFLTTLIVSYCTANIGLVGSVWSTIGLAVDRYNALCHPLQHRHLTTRHRWIGIGAILIVALVVNTPRYLTMHLAVTADVYYNTTSNYINRRHFEYEQVFVVSVAIIGILFVSCVPALLLLILAIGIALELRRTSNNMAAEARAIALSPHFCRRASHAALQISNRRNRIQYKTNVISFIIVLKSIVFHTLPVFLDILDVLMISEVPFQLLGSPYHQLLVDISNFLVTLNTTFNIFIYCNHTEFRSVLLNLGKSKSEIRRQKSVSVCRQLNRHSAQIKDSPEKASSSIPRPASEQTPEKAIVKKISNSSWTIQLWYC